MCMILWKVRMCYCSKPGGIGDPYLEKYEHAMKQVEAFAPSMVPFFTPIATRYCNDWSAYVRKVVSDTALMGSPERLEVTRLLVLATKMHMLVERLVLNPQQRKHSRDWLSFYDEDVQPERGENAANQHSGSACIILRMISVDER